MKNESEKMYNPQKNQLNIKQTNKKNHNKRHRTYRKQVT